MHQASLLQIFVRTRSRRIPSSRLRMHPTTILAHRAFRICARMQNIRFSATKRASSNTTLSSFAFQNSRRRFLPMFLIDSSKRNRYAGCPSLERFSRCLINRIAIALRTPSMMTFRHSFTSTAQISFLILPASRQETASGSRLPSVSARASSLSA